MMFLIQIYTSKNGFKPWDIKPALRMAETMRRMEAASEPVTPENLIRRGYASEDVESYGLKAAHLARKLSVKVVMS